MARKSVWVLVLLGMVAWLQPPLTPRPPACAAGRFVGAGAGAPVIEIHDGTIALPGRCPPTPATFAAPQRSGTPLRAAWAACDVPGRFRLRGELDAACTRIRGVLVDAGGAHPFHARRPQPATDVARLVRDD